MVLKRLDKATADGDHIHAIIKGSALNNDGALKIGYTAPGVDGQAAVIAASAAWVVGWVEARPDGGFGHGLSRAETHHLGGIVDEAGFGAGKIAGTVLIHYETYDLHY